MNKYHYVYRITNIKENKHYYGSRTSTKIPKEDLGVIYYSSSCDKDFINDQKTNKENYKYIIVRCFDNRKECILFEIFLHEKFNVAKNDKFYNKSQQTSTGFLYGMLGKKQTIKHKESAKKGDMTKRNTILENGLNIHQNAIRKWKENLDVILDGEKMTTRDKLKTPKKDKSNYIQEFDKINIFDNNGKLFYEVNIPLEKFCKLNNLPYTAFYKSKKYNTKLYDDVTRQQTITILIKKDYYKYKGWYARKR